MTVKSKIKVLLALFPLENHSRGIITVAGMLRDAGMEVVLIGNELPERTIDTAIQEDVDVVGISSLDGGHMTIFSEILDGLKKEDRADIMVVAGGVIPLDEAQELKKMGVAEVFRAGTVTDDVVKFIKGHVG